MEHRDRWISLGVPDIQLVSLLGCTTRSSVLRHTIHRLQHTAAADLTPPFRLPTTVNDMALRIGHGTDVKLPPEDLPVTSSSPYLPGAVPFHDSPPTRKPEFHSNRKEKVMVNTNSKSGCPVMSFSE